MLVALMEPFGCVTRPVLLYNRFVGNSWRRASEDLNHMDLPNIEVVAPLDLGSPSLHFHLSPKVERVKVKGGAGAREAGTNEQLQNRWKHVAECCKLKLHSE